MLTHIIFLYGIVSISHGFVPDQEIEVRKYKMMENELEELKSTVSKLVSAIKVASSKKMRTPIEETEETSLENISVDDLVALLKGRDGRDGLPGDDGRDGLPGLPGRDGDSGPKGAPGTDGTNGAPGEQGVIGDTGPRGVTGQKGVKGSAGEPGENGGSGPRGLTGQMGVKGSAGEHGEKGERGIRGLRGQPGVEGTTGEPGAIERGPIGLTGPNGIKGSTGASGNAGLSGSVYTRWGRKSCGSSSIRLYEGFTAGGHYTHGGGGVDYQCLPLDPQFDSYSATGSTVSWIYGTEYETSGYPSSMSSRANNQNVPCARCYSTRSAVLMIPARRYCPSNWSMEYRGYLMSAYYNHAHPATYECVDGSPEYVTGQSGNVNGALFYFVKTACSGSGAVGHCPPYADNKWIQCVVCTK